MWNLNINNEVLDIAAYYLNIFVHCKYRRGYGRHLISGMPTFLYYLCIHITEPQVIRSTKFVLFLVYWYLHFYKLSAYHISILKIPILMEIGPHLLFLMKTYFLDISSTYRPVVRIWTLGGQGVKFYRVTDPALEILLGQNFFDPTVDILLGEK